MELTHKQEEGLKIAVARYKNHEKYTCISGYAGTGKTTLIKFIVTALPGVDPEEDVCYVAYTGKAANVLKNHGFRNARTAHKLLYEARMMPNGKYKFSPRVELEDHPLVVVVDEVSMLPKDMWDLLCSHNVYILACGDPAQLPVIQDNPKEDKDNHVLDNPHIFLDEIVRQAKESEIIRFSMHLREGNSLFSYTSDKEEVMLFDKADLTDDVMLWADQVLCATNGTCGRINTRMRAALGFSGDPQIGDKIINRHNEWDFCSNLGNPLTNGVIGNICDMAEKREITYPGHIRKQAKMFSIPVFWCNMTGDEENEKFSGIMFDYEYMCGRPESLNGSEKYMINKLKAPLPFTFTYGYGITTWKA